MDLGGECSEPRPVNENNETLERETSFDGVKLESNGSCGNEISGSGSVGILDVKTLVKINGKENELEAAVQTASNVAETSPGGSGDKAPAPKGYGLKKWRRIRRDFTNNEGNGVDFNKNLKRGLSNATESAKPRNPSVDIKQASEDSVASADSSVKSPDLPDGFAVKGSSFDSTLGVGSAFAFGTESENSGDQSSKSSTAASAPRLRYDVHIPMGSVRDKHRVKNSSGRSSSNAVQKSPQVKGRIETGKKFRGERFKVDMENSYSSVESDLRSSNVVFTQTHSIYGTNNGRQCDYDGENSDKAQASDPQSSEEARKDYCNENGGDNEEVSQGFTAGVSLKGKAEESENHRLQTDWDPLVKSINTLQAVQEALELEILKFGELGKEPVLLSDDLIRGQGLAVQPVSSDPKIKEPNSSGHLHSDPTDKSGLEPLEAELINLSQKVHLLESKLDEASAMLEAKESRVVELEDILNRSGLLNEKSESTLLSLQDQCKKMEIELEDMLKEKIEAEIEYLAIARTTQNMKVFSEDQNLLFEEQKSLFTEQNQMLQKLREAESKATVLKKHAEEVDASCQELLDTEEVFKIQSKLCKHSLCFFVQFMLLFLAFVLFLFQLFPQSTGVVPT